MMYKGESNTHLYRNDIMLQVNGEEVSVNRLNDVVQQLTNQATHYSEKNLQFYIN